MKVIFKPERLVTSIEKKDKRGVADNRVVIIGHKNFADIIDSIFDKDNQDDSGIMYRGITITIEKDQRS